MLFSNRKFTARTIGQRIQLHLGSPHRGFTASSTCGGEGNRQHRNPGIRYRKRFVGTIHSVR